MTSSGIDKEAIMKLRVSFLKFIKIERDRTVQEARSRECD